MRCFVRCLVAALAVTAACGKRGKDQGPIPIDDCTEKTIVGQSFQDCDFYLDDQKSWPAGVWNLCYAGEPNQDNVIPFSPVIFSQDDTPIGAMTSTADNEYLDEFGNWKPLAELGAGLTDDQIQATTNTAGAPRLGNVPSSAASQKVLNDLYIRVHFSQWDVLDAAGNVQETVTTPTASSCLVFYSGYCLKDRRRSTRRYL